MFSLGLYSYSYPWASCTVGPAQHRVLWTWRNARLSTWSSLPGELRNILLVPVTTFQSQTHVTGLINEVEGFTLNPFKGLGAADLRSIPRVSFTEDEWNPTQAPVSAHAVFMLYVYDSIKADGWRQVGVPANWFLSSQNMDLKETTVSARDETGATAATAQCIGPCLCLDCGYL